MEVAMSNIDYSRDKVRAMKAQPRSVAIGLADWPAITARSRIVAAVSTPDFVAIAIFCAIGLLATLNLVLNVPDIGLL
jgi:predicted transcriptional regulator